MFERLANEDVAYLTTTGRRTGRRHRIEIWFAIEGGAIYLLSGGGDAADWVKNIRAERAVRVRIGSRSIAARGSILRPGTEDRRARELLDAKYMGWLPGKRLSAWARGALAVRIDPVLRPRARPPHTRPRPR